MRIIYLLLTLIVISGCNSAGFSTDEDNDLLEEVRAMFRSDAFWEAFDINQAPRSAPFSRGVNFSAWFETNSAGSIPFTKYTEQDFIDAKNLGVDVIRLPVKMHSMTNGAPNYIIDPLLIRFLDIAVDWAEKHGLYIIIDNHSFDPVLPTSNDIDRILLPVWDQIARHFKNRSSLVLYEILNEPHGISDARWGEVQGRAIETIRRHDPQRLIIVGGTDYNSIRKLSALPRYADNHLIYTFHFYDPHLFTHQGANWGEPSLERLANVPFPHSVNGISRAMPRTPSNLIGTWVEGALSNYRRDAEFRNLNNSLERVIEFARERNVPVFCGEFGVYMVNSKRTDRILWYDFVARSLNKRNISWTSWDYYGGFGIFNSQNGSFAHDVNIDLVSAMGFNPPAQTQREERILNTGFQIYDDYPNREYVSVSSWGDYDFTLYETNRVNGDFAIRWANPDQYNSFSFDFDISRRDFSSLYRDGFVLEFKARASGQARFDVRFVNGESGSSIPWRMRYTIDERILVPDGNWHTIRIPLRNMQEHGAWISSTSRWMAPQGDFSWNSIYRMDFVSEHGDLSGVQIWFDDIRITN